MQIIGTEAGRTSFLLAWEEIRPLNGLSPSVLIPALVDRYKIQFPPEPSRTWAESQNRVSEFRAGVFERDGRQIPLSIIAYSDALAVECFNTDDSDIVIDDLLKWSREMGFRDFIRPPIKVYMSRIIAKFDVDLEKLFGRWAELQALMVQPASRHYGDLGPFGAINIEFRSDSRKVINSVLVSHYSFERRMNEAYSENRYLCVAPLSTSEHVAFLEKVEILAKRANDRNV